MTTIDYRIAVRRRTVREAASRRRLGRLLLVVAFFLVVGLIVVLLQSPVMAVRDIEVVGAARVDVAAVLERNNVVPGVPTISVRTSDIVADIEADPWVDRAAATIRWPGTIAVTVLEHEPIAWISVDGTWYRVSATGALLEQSSPAKRGARVELAATHGALGKTLTGKRVGAALEFLGTLPKGLRHRAVVTSGGKGTLVARIRGHLVDLGSPEDMAEKAAALAAMLDQGVPRRTAISVVSPLRPAIRSPRQVVES